MQLPSALRRLCVCIVWAAAMSCRNDSTAPLPAPTPNFIQLVSDPGDWVGSGKQYEYSQANSVITLSASRGLLQVEIAGDEGWSGQFMSPSTNANLERGMYANLRRYPFNDPATGGLSWYGNNGCNTLSGWFRVDKVIYDSTALMAIDLRFEQHCEGATPALHGTIHWRADDSTEPPGPVTPVPSGLWQPAADATPPNVNYVYLDSDPGDWVGAGEISAYTPATATLRATSSSGLLSIDVSGPATWHGDFKAMSTLTDKLLTGYYGDLGTYPFHNPAKGGLDWFGQGRGCNGVHRWFAIDQVKYAGDSLEAVDLRFEQRCEGSTAALHGVIHWVR